MVFVTLSPGLRAGWSSSQCCTPSFARMVSRLNLSAMGSSPRSRSRTTQSGDVRYGVAHTSGSKASRCSDVGIMDVGVEAVGRLREKGVAWRSAFLCRALGVDASQSITRALRCWFADALMPRKGKWVRPLAHEAEVCRRTSETSTLSSLAEDYFEVRS